MGCIIGLNSRRHVSYSFISRLLVTIPLVIVFADLIRGLPHIVHVSATIGENIKLLCHTSLSTPALWLAIWKDSGSEDILTFVGNIYSKFNGWFELDKTAPGDFNLIIRSTQPRHAGKYICQEDGGFGPGEFTYILNVLIATASTTLRAGTRSRTPIATTTDTTVTTDVIEQNERQPWAENFRRQEGSENNVRRLKIVGVSGAIGLLLFIVIIAVLGLKTCITKRNMLTKRHSDEEIPLNERQANSDKRCRIKRIDSAEIGRDVWGLTKIYDRVYVAWRSTTLIKAFRAIAPFDHLNEKDIDVKDLSVPSGLEGCESSMCLYLADSSNGCIWKFPYADTSKATKWYELSNCEGFIRMTVMNDGRVLLLMCEEIDNGLHWTGKLRMLNANGVAQQNFELALPRKVLNPWHALPLANKTFFVAYGPSDQSATHGILKVNKHGVKAMSDRNKLKLNIPIDATRCGSSGGFYVADSCNGRILLVDEKLRLQSTVLQFECDKGGEGLPTRVIYESRTHTMFVGFASGHVDIFSLQSNPASRDSSRY